MRALADMRAIAKKKTGPKPHERVGGWGKDARTNEQGRSGEAPRVSERKPEEAGWGSDPTRRTIA